MRVLSKFKCLPMAAALAAVLVTGCGGGDGGDGRAAGGSSKEPLKVGIVASKSGPYAALGEEGTLGFKFAVEQANKAGGVNGRRIELIDAGDDEGVDERAVQNAERVTQREKATVIVGPAASSTVLALLPHLQRWNALLVSFTSKSDVLTGEDCVPYFFRANHSDTMDIATIEPWLAKQKEQRFWAIASDYVFGHDSVAGFKRAAKATGKTVIGESFPDFEATDYSSEIAKIREAKPDGVWVGLGGAQAIAFLKQANQFGLLKKSKVIGHQLLFTTVMEGVGEPMLGVEGLVNYSPKIDTPQNRDFVKAFERKHGRLPATYEALGYNAMQTVLAAVAKADSVKADDIAAALEGLQYETVFGQVTMRAEDHQALLPNYFGAVARDQGAYVAEIDFEVTPDEIAGQPKACGKGR